MSKLDANKWVNNYGDMLYRFALPRVRDEELAKDLVQETFLAAWRNEANFKGEISEKNWLFTILKNKIIDHYRKASTRLTENFSDKATEDNFFDEADHWTNNASPKEWKTDDTKNIETKEFYEVLEKCKMKLKELQSAVFSLKYLDGFESEEICKELGITPSNYWVLLHRAKLQLRGCLEKNWFLK
jgi:RNA polymerase sigma-70 factor (TIGR02943 family)